MDNSHYQPSKTRQVKKRMSSKLINVSFGTPFSLTFPITLGTGYSYMISTGAELQLQTPNGIVAHNSVNGRVGASTTIQYTFQAVQPGRSNIDIIYGRPWDPTTWTATHYSVVIH